MLYSKTRAEGAPKIFGGWNPRQRQPPKFFLKPPKFFQTSESFLTVVFLELRRISKTSEVFSRINFSETSELFSHKPPKYFSYLRSFSETPEVFLDLRSIFSYIRSIFDIWSFPETSEDFYQPPEFSINIRRFLYHRRFLPTVEDIYQPPKIFVNREDIYFSYRSFPEPEFLEVILKHPKYF